MRHRKRWALPDIPAGSLQDLIETSKARIRAMVEHLSRVTTQQFGFQRTLLRVIA